jgi:hypothetical protein
MAALKDRQRKAIEKCPIRRDSRWVTVSTRVVWARDQHQQWFRGIKIRSVWHGSYVQYRAGSCKNRILVQ